LESFSEEFFGRIFLGGFFWRRFFGGFFLGGRIFLGGILCLKFANLFESERNLCFCQDFVSKKKEARNLDP
jgi:hypothetical protein